MKTNDSKMETILKISCGTLSLIVCVAFFTIYPLIDPNYFTNGVIEPLKMIALCFYVGFGIVGTIAAVLFIKHEFCTLTKK